MPSADEISPADVLDFWRRAGPRRWFRKDGAFDRRFRDLFLPAHEAAARGGLDGWADGADGALALLILLDQFPRNAFRDSARAWATDPLALRIAHQALAHGFDLQADDDLRNFFYLPLMHSERLADQELALAKTAALGEEPLRHARIHHDTVARFGRFPHRNVLLGRVTTPDEQAFLDAGGFAG